MWCIEVMEGEHRGRILTIYTLSSDERYAQTTINREIVEFRLGYDCRWVYPDRLALEQAGRAGG